jgi:hypothetical protein
MCVKRTITLFHRQHIEFEFVAFQNGFSAQVW